MDLYDLLMAEDEPNAQEKARAMAEAVRRRQAVGTLGTLTGDRVLSRLGQGQLQQASDESANLAAAGKLRSGSVLQRTLASQRQTFDAGEAEKDRGARAAEGARNRALQRTLMGEKKAAKGEADEQKAGNRAFDDAAKLRSAFDRDEDVKQFKNISTSFAKLRGAAATPSAAGDLSMIFSIMKMLDPGVSVMEGDVANASQATGVPAQMLNTYNRVVSGQRLTPEQRADFMKQGEGLFAVHAGRVAPVVTNYRRMAQERGLNPDDVAQELGAGGVVVSASAKATPSNGNISLDTAPTQKVVNGKTYALEDGEWFEVDDGG